MKSPVDKESGQVAILGDFSDKLLMLHATFRTLIGQYIEISTNRVSVFKLGWVFLLFPQLG